MRTRVPEEATCAICGRYFDPSETRGWCPNPSCGEWQHPYFSTDRKQEADRPDVGTGSGSGTAEPTPTCPSCGDEVRAGASFCEHCGHAFVDGTGAEPAGGGPEEDGLRCPDCDADLSGIDSDKLSRCPFCQLRFDPDFGKPAGRGEAVPEGLTECPNCGEDLTLNPKNMRTVCPACRFDLASGSPAPARRQKAGAGPSPDDPTAAPIDTVEAIEPGFERQLGGAGVKTVGDLLDIDPDDLSTKTGIAAQRIQGWIDAARREVGGSRTGPTGPDDDLGGEQTTIQRSPAELVFEVMGREISVKDGQTVGSEIRSAMVDADASKEDAVYVHRKHVRIEAEGDAFFLTRLGENNLELNGNPVDKGQRVQIVDGDEINFSDVVAATVSVR